MPAPAPLAGALSSALQALVVLVVTPVAQSDASLGEKLSELMDSGGDYFNGGVTGIFIIIVFYSYIVIRSRYKQASKGIVKLREAYDRMIRRAEVDADKASTTQQMLVQHLTEQEKIYIDDASALLEKKAGIGRKIKFHDQWRREREELRRQVEEAKTRTEALPIIGILGTIFGLVLASLSSESIQGITGGIWIALLSSLFALSVMLVVKFTYESDVLSELENLEDREALVYEYISLREDTEIRLREAARAKAEEAKAGK